MPGILTFCFANCLVSRRVIYFLFFACLANPVHADSLTVSVVLSDTSQPYQHFSAGFHKFFAKNNADVVVVESYADEKPKAGRNEKFDLIVAVGSKATELALTNSNAPLLSIMVPKAGYDALLDKHSPQKLPKTVSAIYLDQPWSRQLNFIQAALPKHNIVGVLYSPNTHIVLPRLPRGMSLNAKSVRSTDILFDTLENILISSDVLLVIPDSEIYSSNNVRNILLTSYRYKVPLIGISQAYVNAGALGAIFSTPEQLAEQAGEMIDSFAKSRQLPEPQYPLLFSISLNQQVARSLGIVLDSQEVILERMNKGGEGGR
jgi:ABC-type uncharacterized transport system substrate-binding protein